MKNASLPKRAVSIIFNLLLLLVGIAFFLGSFNISDGGDLNVSAAYYPRLVSGGIVFFSLWLLGSDLFGAGRHEKERLNLGNAGNLIATLILMIAATLCWSMFDQLYLGMGVGLAALLYLLNPESSKKKRILFAIPFSILFSLAVYLIFEVALAIKL